MLLLVAAASFVCGAIYSLSHFDDPLAIIVVSDNPAIALTQETALQLTADACAMPGWNRSMRSRTRHDANYPERFLGRNSLHPDDQVSVIWREGWKLRSIHSPTAADANNDCGYRE